MECSYGIFIRFFCCQAVESRRECRMEIRNSLDRFVSSSSSSSCSSSPLPFSFFTPLLFFSSPLLSSVLLCYLSCLTSTFLLYFKKTSFCLLFLSYQLHVKHIHFNRYTIIIIIISIITIVIFIILFFWSKK